MLKQQQSHKFQNMTKQDTLYHPITFVSNGIRLSRENKIKQMQQILSSGLVWTKMKCILERKQL